MAWAAIPGRPLGHSWPAPRPFLAVPGQAAGGAHQPKGGPQDPAPARTLHFSPGMKHLFLLTAMFSLAACVETTTGGSGGGTGGTGGTTDTGGGGQSSSTGGTGQTGGTGGEGGAVTTTPVPCTDCLANTIKWGPDGGLVSWIDSATLTDCRTFTFYRDPGYGQDPVPTQTCTAEVGGCDAPPVAIHEVEQALAHPHVVAALAEATTPLYGWDSRCTDGSITTPLAMTGMHVGVRMPDGSRCRAYFSSPMTTVWPALFPPWYRTT